MSISTISPAALAAICKEGQPIDLVDVRTPVEFREVHVAARERFPWTNSIPWP